MRKPSKIFHNDMQDLAINNPQLLIDKINNNELNVVELSFAADVIGKFIKSEVAVPCLINLLKSNFPLVRECAIYGLENHISSDNVLSKNIIMILKYVSKNDAAEGVRQAAIDILEEI